MGEKATERFLWAIEQMDIDPSDRLLEIGCGNGAMLSLICDRLDEGRILAIDRSETMAAKAAQRNRKNLESGKADIRGEALREAKMGSSRFSKIFAFNVNVFWMRPERELNLLKALLEQNGFLYLFFQPPSVGKIEDIAEKTQCQLIRGGFSVHGVTVGPMSPSPVVCIRASCDKDPKRVEGI